MPAEGQPTTPIEWGRSFLFFRNDPEWIKKVAFGALFMLLSFVIVGALFLAGYLFRLIRSVAKGIDDRLPDWNDLGAIFSDGLKAAGAYLVLVLPLVLVTVVGQLIGALLAGAAGHVDNRSAAAAGSAIGGILVAGVMLVCSLLSLAVMLYLPAAFIRQALSGEFRAVFAFRENLAFIRRQLGQYLLALVIYWAAGLVATLGYLACCVGILATSFWALCVLGWGLGSVARRDPEMVALIGGAGPSSAA